MSKRWPLHPPPFPNESLLSWIMRIASLYDMEPKNLLMYEFGINLEVHNLYSIDLNRLISLLADYLNALELNLTLSRH